MAPFLPATTGADAHRTPFYNMHRKPEGRRPHCAYYPDHPHAAAPSRMRDALLDDARTRRETGPAHIAKPPLGGTKRPRYSTMPAMEPATRSTRSERTARAAARVPFFTASTLVAPCPMSTTPLMPRRIAPPRSSPESLSLMA